TPPSRESWTSTVPPPTRTTLPDQAIASRRPIVATNPALGDVTVSVGLLSVKVRPLIPKISGRECILTRTLAVVVGFPPTRKELLPVFAVSSATGSQLAPLSRESSTSTVPVTPSLVQVIVCWLPISHSWPPLGETTLIEGSR